MSKIRQITKNTKNSRKMLKKLNIINKVSRGGRIYSVKFTKKNGEERSMCCRQSVKKHLRGGGYNTVSHIPELVTTFSINDKGYRNFNLKTLKEVKGCGEVFTF